jgi:hypothetical protein
MPAPLPGFLAVYLHKAEVLNVHDEPVAENEASMSSKRLLSSYWLRKLSIACSR